MNKQLVEDFLKVLSKEINYDILPKFEKEGVSVTYHNMKITIYSGIQAHATHSERDIVDSLCRLRLLIIEKLNRVLPNSKRHEAYQDIDPRLPSVFETDFSDHFIITF